MRCLRYRRQVFSHGMIAWRKLDCKAVDWLGGLIIRVVGRQVVAACPRWGRAIVRSAESSALKEGGRPDVLVMFLHSVPKAVKSHRRHGYKELYTHNGMKLMVRQIHGKVCRTLTHDEIVRLAKIYFN